MYCKSAVSSLCHLPFSGGIRLANGEAKVVENPTWHYILEQVEGLAPAGFWFSHHLLHTHQIAYDNGREVFDHGNSWTWTAGTANDVLSALKRDAPDGLSRCVTSMRKPFLLLTFAVYSEFPDEDDTYDFLGTGHVRLIRRPRGDFLIRQD